jgi:hypothetical protein
MYATGQISSESIAAGTPLYSKRVISASEKSSTRALGRQKSSPILSRLRWAATERSQFLSAVAELSKGNDLLESLLRIKSHSDPTFQASPRKGRQDRVTESTRSWLERLHGQLISMNPRGNEVEFSIRLALDELVERTTYSDLIDRPFDPKSSVFALQAHSGSSEVDRNKSLYLLAEVPVTLEETSTKIEKLTESFLDIDPTADPAIKVIGTHPAEITEPNLRLYQDCTAEWTRIKTLSEALRNEKLQSAHFQRYHVQLALLIAFSFAILPCTYEGKGSYPMASDYVYYDQLEEPAADIDSQEHDSRDTQNHENDTTTAEHLLSPWYHFNLGSRPRGLSTKGLGKRPGVLPTTHNPLVALGILLTQIGLWQPLTTSGGITQMRNEVLEKSHDLIRLSGVEFEEVTRRCLDWKEYGEDEKQNDVQEMLQVVFERLEEHSRALQRLL